MLVILNESSNGLISLILLPIWNATPSKVIFLYSPEFLKILKASSTEIPNLFSLFPVVIFPWVFGSTSGLILRATFCLFPTFPAIVLTLLSSLRDSTFICRQWFLIAKDISSSVLPTPEKTILFASILAFSAFFNSPSDTTSAPAPKFDKIFRIDRLEFDFNEKQIFTSMFLKLLLKLL